MKAVKSRHIPFMLTRYSRDMPTSSSGKYPSIADLYPGLTPEEQMVAQENIDRYIGVILRICKRMESDAIGDSGSESEV